MAIRYQTVNVRLVVAKGGVDVTIVGRFFLSDTALSTGRAVVWRMFTHELDDDPTRRRPDYTRARQRHGWRLRVSLPDGLRKTVEYFREAEATTAPFRS
jgi:nucleoside-diphosphate-sugar epimerase